MDFPSYTPAYAKDEFTRLIEIYSSGNEFDILDKWRSDSRMKFIYKSIKKSTCKEGDKGYFILAMLDSATLDLDKFKREDELLRKLDKEITNELSNIFELLSKRIAINDYAPRYYRDLVDYIGKLNLCNSVEIFTPKMVKLANATRQSKSANYEINKSQHARALIVNLSDNDFDVSEIKEAIATALNIIYDYPDQIFSIDDVRNSIRALSQELKRDTDELLQGETDELPPAMKVVCILPDETKEEAAKKAGVEINDSVSFVHVKDCSKP